MPDAPKANPTKKFAVIELHIIVTKNVAADFHKTVEKFEDLLGEDEDVLYFANTRQRELTEVEYNDAQTAIDPEGSLIADPQNSLLASFKDRELLDELRRRGYLKGK